MSIIDLFKPFIQRISDKPLSRPKRLTLKWTLNGYVIQGPLTRILERAIPAQGSQQGFICTVRINHDPSLVEKACLVSERPLFSPSLVASPVNLVAHPCLSRQMQEIAISERILEIRDFEGVRSGGYCKPPGGEDQIIVGSLGARSEEIYAVRTTVCSGAVTMVARRWTMDGSKLGKLTPGTITWGSGGGDFKTS